MNDCVIQIKDVTMHFNLMVERVDSIKEYILKIMKGNLLYNDFVALSNVSFNVYKGEIVGLVGLNGAGFDPELTARENIFLNGAILGYDKNFMQEKFDDIVDFSELKNFIDVPVKNFSSGMYARLGFAIATMVQPDILIVDEVLSVGDYKFQKKCENRIQMMINNGVTVILVSHDIGIIKNLCTKAVWLEHGHVKDIGPVDRVCAEYEA